MLIIFSIHQRPGKVVPSAEVARTWKRIACHLSLRCHLIRLEDKLDFNEDNELQKKNLSRSQIVSLTVECFSPEQLIWITTRKMIFRFFMEVGALLSVQVSQAN